MKIVAVVGDTTVVARENLRGEIVLQHIDNADTAAKARAILAGPSK